MRTKELKERVEAIKMIAQEAYEEAPDNSCAEKTARAVLHLTNLVDELIRLEHLREIIAKLDERGGEAGS